MPIEISCTDVVRIKHTAGEPKQVLDEENGNRPFLRTHCAHCGVWMSDSPYLDQGTQFPRLESAGVAGAVEEGKRQLYEATQPSL